MRDHSLNYLFSVASGRALEVVLGDISMNLIN